jgi:hypothetical protein
VAVKPHGGQHKHQQKKEQRTLLLYLQLRCMTHITLFAAVAPLLACLISYCFYCHLPSPPSAIFACSPHVYAPDGITRAA